MSFLPFARWHLRGVARVRVGTFLNSSCDLDVSWGLEVLRLLRGRRPREVGRDDVT